MKTTSSRWPRVCGRVSLPRPPEVKLEGVVEIDEVYVVAGHKGNPVATQKKVARDGAGA